MYDLFGDGRTALKTSWSRYYRNYDGDIAANAYGRAGERSENRAWFDRNLIAGTNTPSGAAVTVLCPGVRVLPTDCDGIAQDNEIGISPSGGAFARPPPHWSLCRTSNNRDSDARALVRWPARRQVTSNEPM